MSWSLLAPTDPIANPHRESVLVAPTLKVKWADVNFSNLIIDIQRSIYRGHIGSCKTEASRKPVPLDLDVAADLWLWREESKFGRPDD
jgi:integrase